MLFDWDQHFWLGCYLESFPLDVFFFFLILMVSKKTVSHRQVSYCISQKTTGIATAEAHLLQLKTQIEETLSLPPLSLAIILVPADLGVRFIPAE